MQKIKIWLSDIVKAIAEVAMIRQLKPGAFDVLKKYIDEVRHPVTVYTNVTRLIKVAKETPHESNRKVLKRILWYVLCSRPKINLETYMPKMLGAKTIDQVVVENVLYISKYLFPAERLEKEVFLTGNFITDMTNERKHEDLVEDGDDHAFYWRVPEETPVVTVCGVSRYVYNANKYKNVKRINLLTNEEYKPKPYKFYPIKIGEERVWVKELEDLTIEYRKNKINPSRFNHLTKLFDYQYSITDKAKGYRKTIAKVQNLSYVCTVIKDNSCADALFSKDCTYEHYSKVFKNLEALRVPLRAGSYKIFIYEFFKDAFEDVIYNLTATQVQKLVVVKNYIGAFLSMEVPFNLEAYAAFLVDAASSRELWNIINLSVHYMDQEDKPMVDMYGSLMDEIAYVDTMVDDNGVITYGNPAVLDVATDTYTED